MDTRLIQNIPMHKRILLSCTTLREGNEIMSETAGENQVYGPLSIKYIHN